MTLSSATLQATLAAIHAEIAWKQQAEAFTPTEIADLIEQALAGTHPDGELLEARLARMAHDKLSHFVRQLWTVLEPAAPLEWTWHFDVICDELEKVTSGEIRDLLICIPPGMCKSLLVSVLWPAWWWLRDPSRRFLTVSGDETLAIRDNRRMREVVESPWYRRLVAQQEARGVRPWGLAKDQNQKRHFENSARGLRQCFGLNGSITGNRGHGMIVDDPVQVKDVLGDHEQVQAALDKAWNLVSVVLPSRVIDHRTSFRVTIMQRLHQRDPAGRILAEGKARTVILPMRFKPDSPHRHPEDPRTEDGELLDPVRTPQAAVDKLARQLDVFPGQASAQLDQDPIPSGGGTFKRAWMEKSYPWDPQRPPVPYTEIAITVDATFKKSKTSAFVSFQAWGRRGWTEYHLLDELHEKMSYVDTKTALKHFWKKWSRASVVLVETKANGEALLDDLRNEIPCLVGFTPDAHGDKVARAQLSTGMWASGSPEGGGVWLPEAEFAPWIGDYCNELAAFPGGLHKDRVDAMSQLFLWWQERRRTGNDEGLVSAMQEILQDAEPIDWFG